MKIQGRALSVFGLRAALLALRTGSPAGAAPDRHSDRK